MKNTIKTKKEHAIYRRYIWSLIIALFGSKICGIIALYNIKKLEDKLIDEDDNIKGNEKGYKTATSVGVFFLCLKLFFVFIFILGLITSFNTMMNNSISLQ